MRLTLRTLLAYRDQVLEPKDAENLEQRLRESQAARSISDRISQLLAHPIATPLAVDAAEFGLNPNDVASFLDDAMGVDRIADMERKCLDNQALLAEVASCHQILVKTIRSPEPVSVGFRNRVVGLWHRRNSGVESNPLEFDERRLRADAAHESVHSPTGISSNKLHPESVEAVSTSPGRTSTRAATPRGVRETPDYLRKSDRPWMGLMFRLLVLLALLAVCISQSLGPRERLQELLQRQPSDWLSQPMERPSPEPAER